MILCLQTYQKWASVAWSKKQVGILMQNHFKAGILLRNVLKARILSQNIFSGIRWHSPLVSTQTSNCRDEHCHLEEVPRRRDLCLLSCLGHWVLGHLYPRSWGIHHHGIDGSGKSPGSPLSHRYINYCIRH